MHSQYTADPLNHAHACQDLSSPLLPNAHSILQTAKLTPFLSTNSELAREKMWSRIYITPLLQAEEDRDQARRYFADQAREKTLLGSQSSAYNSDR